MKLRIKGNTIRLRLIKSEVDYFSSTNFIEEKTEFGKSEFSYALNTSMNDSITAQFSDGKLVVSIPFSFAKEWTSTGLVGLHGQMETGSGKKLIILIEKDFKCLDETIEDQSDNYENPATKK